MQKLQLIVRLVSISVFCLLQRVTHTHACLDQHAMLDTTHVGVCRNGPLAVELEVH